MTTTARPSPSTSTPSPAPSAPRSAACTSARSTTPSSPPSRDPARPPRAVLPRPAPHARRAPRVRAAVRRGRRSTRSSPSSTTTTPRSSCWRGPHAPTCGTPTSPSPSTRRSARCSRPSTMPARGGDTMWTNQYARVRGALDPDARPARRAHRGALRQGVRPPRDPGRRTLPCGCTPRPVGGRCT